jgi:endonuclease G, mitochondrial
VKKDVDAWIRNLVSKLDTADRGLADEIRSLRGTRSLFRRSPGRGRGVGGLSPGALRSLRNIVLRVGRPVLAIVGGKARLQFRDSESEVWRSRLEASSEGLRRAATAVGRIDVEGLPPLEFVGTGWVIDKNTIITNRHVARAFGERAGARFTFKQGARGRPIAAAIDFLEEAGRAQRRVFDIVDIVHIEDDDGPDFALLRVEDRSRGRELAPPIPLAVAPPRPDQQVAVIGYPARDGRVPDQKLVESIFGDVYDKKRLAPGQVTKAQPDVVLHDCSTLGGNSGSVVLDLATGEAVGLHYAGRFLETNYAVPAAVVAERVRQLRQKPAGRPPQPHRPPPSTPGIATHTPDVGVAVEPDLIEEGVPADYVGRAGYDPMFLGELVPLPEPASSSDVLMFPWQGTEERELKYEHFSVVMSRSRRLCLFSAGIIDGSQPKRFKRPPWRLDPRIPKQQQIIGECYGNSPLFSRGHMTRREDPIWGESEAASLGNSDSMHVTNTVPQMQPFNAGIWLGLESYALEHARSDQMRISVFTGPFLLPDDPVRNGVLIPRSFWKVIAFVHDGTGALCATGYTMSQEMFLVPDEFVFGQHTTAQTRIATIEARTGLSFGRLAAIDPFEGDQEGVGGVLTDPGQIVFRRASRA